MFALVESPAWREMIKFMPLLANLIWDQISVKTIRPFYKARQKKGTIVNF